MKHHLRAVYRITDEETGEVCSVIKVSNITKVKVTTIYTWYNNNGCNTIQKIIERSKIANVSGSVPKVHKTCRGGFTVGEISAIMEEETGQKLATTTITRRINIYGAASPVVWFPKCTSKEFMVLQEKAGIPFRNPDWSKYKELPKAPKFDRASICWRDKFQCGCKKYSDMLWDLVDGKFPKCYKSDGSCFDKIDVLKM
jgi:hypothetical protein